MRVPGTVNARWSMDCVCGPLANARRLHVLKTVDFSTSGRRLANELGQRPRPLPKTTVGDNGPAFTSKARYCWAKRSVVKLYFIQPGKPAQNACVERFNGKFREYCFNLNGFASIEDARATTDT